MSLERVWREFGESPNPLQTHSSCPKKMYIEKKMTTEKMKTYEFGASLESFWIISQLTPKSIVFSKQK